MAKNRVFFPQDALDSWLVAGAVELRDNELLLKSEGQRLRLTEGARVLREVTGEPDAYEVVGKCKTLVFLRELGADILERSMIIDDNAYDIVPGFLGVLMPDATTTGRSASSEEERLARFVANNT